MPSSTSSYLGSRRKRALDGIVLLMVMPIALVLMLVTALVLLVSEGRPVLYSQERVGLGGRRFQCLKFRTMVPDAEERLVAALAENAAWRAEWTATRKLRDDPRVTRLGRFLRASSLDELPQLINVLQGHMTLVGPRPVLPEELTLYGHYMEHYMAATPGITGLWQVAGRNETTYRRRVALDMRYVRSASLLMDIGILFGTIRALLTTRGAY